MSALALGLARKTGEFKRDFAQVGVGEGGNSTIVDSATVDNATKMRVRKQQSILGGK